MLTWFKRFELNKDICLWVVPPHDGRVRKVRCSIRRLACIALIAFVCASGIMFLAGDYARVQLQRAQMHFHMSKLMKEKKALADSQMTLEQELRSLQGENQRVLSYEQNLKQRVDELAWILDSAGVLGTVRNDVSKARSKKSEKSKEGMGGAEIDCSADPLHTSCVKAGIGGAEIDRLDSEDFHPIATSDLLVGDLDSLIGALKSLPIGTPAMGYINSGYGYRISPFSGKPSVHQGIDLAVPMGSDVMATADGYVHAVRRSGTYGLSVDIVHENGVLTRYAHLSRAFVEEGEKICRGETVGLVGSSGRSTGPHLHYEVWVNGKPRNPEKFMQLAERLGQISAVRR